MVSTHLSLLLAATLLLKLPISTPAASPPSPPPGYSEVSSDPTSGLFAEDLAPFNITDPTLLESYPPNDWDETGPYCINPTPEQIIRCDHDPLLDQRGMVSTEWVSEGEIYLQKLTGNCGAPAGDGKRGSAWQRVSCSEKCGIYLHNLVGPSRQRKADKLRES